MLLHNQRRYSFIRVPSSLSRSVKLSHRKPDQNYVLSVKTAKTLTNESLQECSTKLSSSTEEKHETVRTVESLSVHNDHNVCSKWTMREGDKVLLPAFAPLHRRPRFLQHYASVCVARDPVMLLTFYLQAAGRYDDLLDVSSSLNVQSSKLNELSTSPISSSFLSRTDAQDHYADRSSVENKVDNVYDYINTSDNVNVEHIVRIAQQMAACVGAGISRNAWPPWVTYFFKLRENQMKNFTTNESNEFSELLCKETRQDLELMKLQTSRYRVGDTQQISKDHSFTPLIIEVRCLLQATTLEIIENSLQKNSNNRKWNINSDWGDMTVFGILRLFAALCAICIAPSRTQVVSLARNILSKRRNARAMVGLALRTFCFASKSWESEKSEYNSENNCSAHSVEELWLQVWKEVTSDVQKELCENPINRKSTDSKESNNNTQSISNANHSEKAEMCRPFTKFVYKTMGLDVKMIEQEYYNWHIHCLLCVKMQARAVKRSTRMQNVLQSTHNEQMEMTSLTLLLTGKVEELLHMYDDNTTECVRALDKLSVQGTLELFTLVPLSWLHNNNNHEVYQTTGEAVLSCLHSEYKLLAQEHVENGKESFYVITRVLKKRHFSVFNTHVQLFVRTINYLLFKLATSTALPTQHSAFNDITCLLQLFSVKTMLHAITSDSNNKNNKSINEAIHDELRCNNLRELVTALYNIVTFVNCTRDKNTLRIPITTDCYDIYNSDAPKYFVWPTTERPTHERKTNQNYRHHCEILYDENNSNSAFALTTTSAVNDTINNEKENVSTKLLKSGKINSAELEGITYAAVNNVYMYKFGGKKENVLFTNEKYETVCSTKDKLQEQEQEKTCNEVIAHTIRVLCNLLLATSAIPSKQPVLSKNELSTLFTKERSKPTLRSHRYEFLLSELPHKVICHVLEELLAHNYTTEVVQLCSCIITHDLIDLRYYKLPLLAKLCQAMEWRMNANAIAKDNVGNNINLMSLEDMECVQDKLQKLYKRRSEVFGEMLATSTNNVSNSYRENSKNMFKRTNSSYIDNNHSKHNQSNANETETEFAISKETSISLSSPLTEWGLTSKHAATALLQNKDANNEIQEFDKSQSCLYARKVASLYQLHNEPQVVSLLHSLLTRVSPLLGGGFTIDRQPHYYNFGEWQVKGNVSTSSNAQERAS